jgi:hypothetical protein
MDGGSAAITGTMTIGNAGIVNFILPAMEPTQQSTMHCAMDSGKSVIACTSNKSNGGNANYYLFTKRATNVSAIDLSGVWHVNALSAPVPWWGRGMINFKGDNTFSVNITGSDGSSISDSGPWSITGDGLLAFGGTMQCRMDSNKGLMACVESDGANARIYTLVRGFSNKPGDCDGSGTVSIAEVQGAINMYLSLMPTASCVDTDGMQGVSIAEVQKVINGYLGL